MAVSTTKHHKSALNLLFEKYKLKKKDASKQISDIHLDKISHSCCSQWRRLPPYLCMERIVKDDVNRLSASEEAEKRSLFFSKWVDEKGSDATYEKLISALLKMGCKNDAEKVCKLLAPKQHRSPHPASDQPQLQQALGQGSKPQPPRKVSIAPNLPPLPQAASDYRAPTGNG